MGDRWHTELATWHIQGGLKLFLTLTNTGQPEIIPCPVDIDMLQADDIDSDRSPTRTIHIHRSLICVMSMLTENV